MITDEANQTQTIDAAGMHYRELNRWVRTAVAAGARHLILENVRGQRFIADGLQGKDLLLDIHGVPGGGLAAFMDGPTVVVFGNGQDTIGNTMNEGKVIIHGNAGDALGYGMRGGSLLVRGNAGYRVGIHMKAYKSQVPQVIIGGCVGDFFGEYLAGGLLVVLGLDRPSGQPLVGGYLASGIHGGEIYLRAALDEMPHMPYLAIQSVENDGLKPIAAIVKQFAETFGGNAEEILAGPFTRLTPISHRPFAAKYAP
jgi:glutamate synthase domain-containing protein 3